MTKGPFSHSPRCVAKECGELAEALGECLSGAAQRVEHNEELVLTDGETEECGASGDSRQLGSSARKSRGVTMRSGGDRRPRRCPSPVTSTCACSLCASESR